MSLTLDNPIVCPAGTNTASFTRSIKVTKVVAIAGSATAVAVNITDLNGNVFMAPMNVPATALATQVYDFNTPLILPGGVATTVTNWIVTVSGSAGNAYIYHR